MLSADRLVSCLGTEKVLFCTGDIILFATKVFPYNLLWIMFNSVLVQQIQKLFQDNCHSFNFSLVILLRAVLDWRVHNTQKLLKINLYTYAFTQHGSLLCRTFPLVCALLGHPLGWQLHVSQGNPSLVVQALQVPQHLWSTEALHQDLYLQS